MLGATLSRVSVGHKWSMALVFLVVVMVTVWGHGIQGLCVRCARPGLGGAFASFT